MEIEKLKRVIYGNKGVGVHHLKQLSTKLTEETTNTSVVSDLPKLIPAVFKYAVHEEKKFREAALPALTELVGLLDLNKHLKEKPWWAEMKADILKSVDVLMNLVTTGDDQWALLWMTVVMMLGSDLRSELTLLNRLLKVVEKAFKMNNEEVRQQGFECWCKLIDNFSINKKEINNKRRLGLLVIPLKANNHNTPRLCASKMKTWKHLLSKLDQHNEMTVELLVTHFLEFMFNGVGSIAPACKTLNTECADIFAQMLKTPLLFRILPELFIKHAFVCIEHVDTDLCLCLEIWESLLDNMKSNQWAEAHVSVLMTCLTNASNEDKLRKSKTFAHMIRTLYSGSHALPSGTLVKHIKTVLSVALEPHVLANYNEAWCNELLDMVTETDPILLPHNIIGDVITKLNLLAVSDLFRDEKLKFLRGMWMMMVNIICKWMADDVQIGKNGNVETDLDNIHQLLFFGAASLSSMWNKLQMKSWKALYSECVKYFSLSTEVKCEKFVSDLVKLLLDGVSDKKIPLHVALDLVSIILEFHLSKDESSVLGLMMKVAESIMNSFQNDSSGTSALLNQFLKIILVAARTEPALVNDILSVTEKMFTSLEERPLIEGHIEKTRNAILKAQIQLNALKPCRSQDRSESPGSTSIPPASSPTMTSFLHRLAKSKETKSKVSSPTPSQSSEVSSSPSRTPNSKQASSPFCDMKSEDFVFVPPKPRKILLTDHQKESLSTRKHDIPALYQDLSQDSSQSAFESIVTPVHVVEKEQLEQGTTVCSPKKQNNFKEVNFRSLSPKKSLVTNINTNSSTSEDKLQNNKENDCVNNNIKSPIKSNFKEIKNAGGAEETPLKVLQDEHKISHDHVSQNVETLANTRLRSRKSLAIDSSGKETITGDEEKYESVSSDLHCHSESTGPVCDEPSKDQTSNKHDKRGDKINENASPNELEIVRKDSSHNSTTPSRSINEVRTPKRSLRKNKLIISVKKSIKKSDEENKQLERNGKEESRLSLSNNDVKSPSSTTTPKVSPRRLRKRKSGVTPILTGGDSIKKVKKSPSSTSHIDTPTNNINKRLSKKGTPIDSKNDKEFVSKNECKESIKSTNEKAESKKNVCESVSQSVKDEIASVSKNEVDESKTINNTEESVIKPSFKSLENKSMVPPEIDDDNEIEVVAIVEGDKNKLSLKFDEKNKTVLNMVNDDSNLLPTKIHQSLKDNVDLIDITCSPVKVVVERLPDVIVIANQFDIAVEKEHTRDLLEKFDLDKKKSAVKNLSSFDTSNNDSHHTNKSMKSDFKSDLGNKGVEEKSVTSSVADVTDVMQTETLNSRKNKESKGGLNKSKTDIVDEKTMSKLVDDEKNKSGSQKRSFEKIQSEFTDQSSLLRKTRSMDKNDVSLNTENHNGEISSTNIVDNEKVLVKEISEDSSDVKITPVKKKGTSESFKLQSVSEANNSPLTTCKQKSSENTPVKGGQKHLKQTQLPFTPIQKTLASESKLNLGSETKSIEKQASIPKKDLKEGKLHLEAVRKVGTSEIYEVLECPEPGSEKKKNKTDEEEPRLNLHKTNEEFGQEKTVKVEAGCELSLADSIPETRQEIQRTPEKVTTSPMLVLCLQRAEVEASEKSILESSNKMTESEDIIASSQETDVVTQSILVSYRNSSNTLKLMSKSPKKSENTSHALNSSERILRSSPLKTENSRFSGTPVKKSVCRRLDVEIEDSEESPDFNEVKGLPTITENNMLEGETKTNQDSEELSDDFKLLNEDNKNTDNHSLPSSRVSEIMNDNLEDNQRISAETSPKSKTLKRFAVESDTSCVGSPKRTMGSLRFDGNDSPVSSPNSRTNQMMELVKQEKERIISSPVSSVNRRRIPPIRVGPVTRTTKTQLIHRTHSGPSEEWVRRTYSPSASPNSSILKRSQLSSPDSSPPSSKKKRVSFLDPPVSESLLFSKANFGKGQVQRPEPKQEAESEELPSQGSVDVEVEEVSNSEAKVFSPLMQCASPVAAILERIVNLQWMPELEAQLGRLGVTTIGQLSSLPEETVQRLPFIPPKLVRLRKILQNYYNEINEKSEDLGPVCPETSEEDQLSPVKDKAEVLNEPPEKTVENGKLQNHQNLESSDDEDILSIAKDIKLKIEQYPELVSQLGNTLHIDVVMKLLDFAVCKLKKGNDKS